MTAKEVIDLLKLESLPEEGGHFKQTYKSNLLVNPNETDKRYSSTAIYYLMTNDQFSALHKLKFDEVFHFYLGDIVEMAQIGPSGQLLEYKLGPNIEKGERLQVLVPGGFWQGSKVSKGGKWALLGTTVSPGFEFEDFTLADREKLIKAFPKLRVTIDKFTRS